MKTKYFSQGFTLIEMAMVIFILGLMMTAFLEPLATRVEEEQRNKTQIQLDEIEEVLYGYVLQNKHLPCPDCRDALTEDCVTVNTNDPTDINDGKEDILADTCATETGNLPWGSTLGVKGTDQWDNNFTYHVEKTFADRNNATTNGTPYSAGPPIVQPGCENVSATLDVSFSLCSDGDIAVWNMADNTDPLFEIVATSIPAVVVSHGKNWASAPSADEAENTNGDAIFVDKDYSQADLAEYDDMLIWISPHILKTMSVKTGMLP
jgi:prepilin-type N-terminal cleavage/methylation domain-containing protein